MFTGIIQSIGQIKSREAIAGDVRLTMDTGNLNLEGVQLGDSIAVNGVCLTVIQLDEKSFSADVSNETLSLTTLGVLEIGAPVNLEKALTLTTPLGGHWVSGHVDGVGEIIEKYSDARSWRFTIAVPDPLMRYIAAKGSICVEGISLTVNQVQQNTFTVNIVPHTSEKTNIGGWRTQSKVNIEVDIIARYLERLTLYPKRMGFRGGVERSKPQEHSISYVTGVRSDDNKP